MAGVFLSYDRRDTAQAQSIAAALEKAGHKVWWDAQVAGGAQFAKAIETALGEAEAVIVLWSAHSVESAWVRDEAAAGRDAGKLVPLSLDGSQPPIGFRQYQSLDFSVWKGRARSSQWKQLLSAIAGLSGEGKREVADPLDRGPMRALPGRAWIIAASAVAALAVVAFVLLRPFGDDPRIPSLAVKAADNSTASRALERDLFIKLGRLQAANPKALKIVQEGAGEATDFTFEVAAHPSADKAAANVAMLDKERTLLWSRDFERPRDQQGDLQQQLALTSARVLECATEAMVDEDARLDQQSLKLYLNGCASLAEMAWHDFRSLVPLFRQVTERAPRFDGAWAKLVSTEAFVIGWETVPSNSPEGKRLWADIATARKLDPAMPAAYWAEYMLVGEYDLLKAADVVERAVRDNPADLEVLAIRMPFLRRVGRTKEAMADAKRGYDLNPLDPGALASYIEVLTYAGEYETALREMAEGERLWPGTRPLIEARFRYHLRYGDPAEALRIVRSGVNPDYADFESFIAARISPTKENVDRAIADAGAKLGEHPRAVGWYIQALAQFGREDMIYQVVEGPQGRTAIYLSDVFFRPAFARFIRNPRFMRTAKNIGLLAYWQKSGKWPDFCSAPDLPYDCKTEAAKLTA